MKQLTEDYISYETAKLLKEKKFGWKCNTVYLEFEDDRIELRYEDKALYQEQTKVRYCVPALLAPSLYNVMKWLREMHKINIVIGVASDDNNLYSLWKFDIWNGNYSIIWGDKQEKFNSYEEACEAAIKYCLENLIS